MNQDDFNKKMDALDAANPGPLKNLLESKPYTPEDHLAGSTSLPLIEGLAAQSFNDYYHKIRADVSMNLWQTIFYKGFSAATKIYETFRDNEPFQKRVGIWVQKCFGSVVRYNREERTQRFLEESIELAQAMGLSKEGALALVEYTYGRPVGVVEQELGGVMVTLAALCDACQLDMVKEGEVELTRVLDPKVMEKIQAKQATKPANSSLPGRTPVEPSGKFKIVAFHVHNGKTEFHLVRKAFDSKDVPTFWRDLTRPALPFNTSEEAEDYIFREVRPKFRGHQEFQGLDFHVVPL